MVLIALMVIGADSGKMSYLSLSANQLSDIAELMGRINGSLGKWSDRSRLLIHSGLEAIIERMLEDPTNDIDSATLTTIYGTLYRVSAVSDEQLVEKCASVVFSDRQEICGLCAAPTAVVKKAGAHLLLIQQRISESQEAAIVFEKVAMAAVGNQARRLDLLPVWMHETLLPKVAAMLVDRCSNDCLSLLIRLLPRWPSLPRGGPACLSSWEATSLVCVDVALRRNVLSSKQVMLWVSTAASQFSVAGLLLSVFVLQTHPAAHSALEVVVASDAVGRLLSSSICNEETMMEGFSAETVLLCKDPRDRVAIDAVALVSGLRRSEQGAQSWHVVAGLVECVATHAPLGAARLHLVTTTRLDFADLNPLGSAVSCAAKHYSLWWKAIGTVWDEFSAKEKVPDVFSGADLQRLAWERVLCQTAGGVPEVLDPCGAFLVATKVLNQSTIVR